MLSLPYDLVKQLMIIDCEAIPNGLELFDAWARGGKCPYDDVRQTREISFTESRELWLHACKNPVPKWSLYKIWKELAKVASITIDKYNAKER
jgi:hypothetical protein